MRRQRGAFSLIEVLVALAIFTLAVAVMAQGVNNAMHAIDVVKSETERDQSFRFASRQILKIEDRNEVEDGGAFSLANDGKVLWQAVLEETEILDLFKLEVTMSLEGVEGLSEEEEYLEAVYIWRPEWSISEERSSLLQRKKDALRQ